MKKSLLIATILTVCAADVAIAREEFYTIRRDANPSVMVDLSVLNNLVEKPAPTTSKKTKKTKASKTAKKAEPKPLANGEGYVQIPNSQPSPAPQIAQQNIYSGAPVTQNYSRSSGFTNQPVYTYQPSQGFVPQPLQQEEVLLNPNDYVSNTSVTIKSNAPAVEMEQKILPAPMPAPLLSIPVAVMPEAAPAPLKTLPKPTAPKAVAPKVAAPKPVAPAPSASPKIELPKPPAPLLAAPKLPAPAPKMELPKPPVKTLADAKPVNSLPPMPVMQMPSNAAEQEDMIMIPAIPPAPPPLAAPKAEKAAPVALPKPAPVAAPKPAPVVPPKPVMPAKILPAPPAPAPVMAAPKLPPALPPVSAPALPPLAKPALPPLPTASSIPALRPTLPALPTPPAPPLPNLAQNSSAPQNLEVPKTTIPAMPEIAPAPRQLLKDISKPDISAVASAPSEISPALAVTAPNVSVTYSEAETELPLTEQGKLQAIANAMAADKTKVLNIIAYASGTAEQAGAATRTSLARGLAVRRFFLDRNIDRERINVRPLGNKSTEGVPDRVDIFLDNSSKG